MRKRASREAGTAPQPDPYHLVHWLQGGATDVENGAKLCRRHHTLCHEGGWTLWRDEAGEYHADPP